MILKKIRGVHLLIFGLLSSIISLTRIKECLNDNKGGLILPFGGGAFNDEDWFEYSKLEIDWSISSVNPLDLPEEFSDVACKFVDEFRRRTINEDVEWFIYFDYVTGEPIYCWKGGVNKVGGVFNRINFFGRNVASIHNHPKGYYSFPSPENFDLLKHFFEDFEVITSNHAVWTVEFKGVVDETVRSEFNDELETKYNSMFNIISSFTDDVSLINQLYEKFIGNYLLTKIDEQINGVNLKINKKEYD